MMYWYNPITKEEEEAYPPAFDAQAIGMLSGHRHSDRFIEEYRQLRMRPQTDVRGTRSASWRTWPGSTRFNEAAD